MPFMNTWLAVSLMVLIETAPSAGALGSVEAASTQSDEKTLIRRGAVLWVDYCATCHNPIGPSAHSAVEWELIVDQMRVRANIPGDAAKAILQYLKMP
jgi:hypothetical protein